MGLQGVEVRTKLLFDPDFCTLLLYKKTQNFLTYKLKFN